MSTRKKWLAGILLVLVVALGSVLRLATVYSRRLDPYIRQQVIEYLQQRFDSEVEVERLSIHLPAASAVRLLLTRSRGFTANVEGGGVVLRHKGRRDIPPMFIMQSFHFDVDLAGLFNQTRKIQSVSIDGMQINIPPKGSRPELSASKHAEEENWVRTLIVEDVFITNSTLTILPRKRDKKPLQFLLHSVHMQTVGQKSNLKYNAALTNAKPPGEILAEGSFGPWDGSEPGDSPIDGSYDFDHADLGVFKGIAGTLHSTGQFQGTLASMDVRGEATVPNFSLKRAGNPVPLVTRFQVEVDGTNGDTILKPVIGTLGSTTFTTSGTIIKNEEANHRSISLNVYMKKGRLRDMLLLAMKGKPFMEGFVALQTKIRIPPLSGTVREKLELEGTFEVTEGKFLQSAIQDQIDTLSRRGQGRPKNYDIDEVVSQMGGAFKLDDEVIEFSPISFAVPGSGIDLSGSYDMDKDILDFHGTLRMQAKVSQTMTGWKHWVLKPFDPFFSKQGAGTLLKIRIEGSREKPKFGLDHGKKDRKSP